MDGKLIRWARAVKARQRSSLPVLWLFTDADRLADPRPAARLLPPGLAGIVLRHGDLALARDLARICRARRLVLAVAGNARLAARFKAGLHLRGGKGRPAPGTPFLTSSAHTPSECRRARRAGAALIFISPLFSTQSHPGAPALGPVRWCLLARGAGGRGAALGGITGDRAAALPRQVRAIGAIGAFR